MNNQFATQFLLEDSEELKNTVSDTFKELGVDDERLIHLLTSAVVERIIPLSKAIEIIRSTNLKEMSTVGGGVTGGPTAATFTSGAGEQMATTKAFKGTRKKKYQEGTFEDYEIAIYDGKEDGLTKIYKRGNGYYGINDSFDFTAKDRAELIKKLKEFGYTLLSGSIEEDAPRLAGDPKKTSAQGSKNISAYTSVGYQKAPSAAEAGKKLKSIDVKELWEKLNEGKRYSQFKKEAAIRTKPQQMHEAAKMVHKKLEEIAKILEFTRQMRSELSEGEEVLEYTSNTKKVFEKIHTKVVEVYSKVKGLK